MHKLGKPEVAQIWIIGPGQRKSILRVKAEQTRGRLPPGRTLDTGRWKIWRRRGGTGSGQERAGRGPAGKANGIEFHGGSLWYRGLGWAAAGRGGCESGRAEPEPDRTNKFANKFTDKGREKQRRNNGGTTGEPTTNTSETKSGLVIRRTQQIGQ